MITFAQAYKSLHNQYSTECRKHHTHKDECESKECVDSTINNMPSSQLMEEISTHQES